MLKRILILLVLALAQEGCSVDEGGGMYQPIALTPEGREGIERLKRDFLHLEDVKSGDGPIAAWGRKVEANINVRYPDGTLVYDGPAFAYAGMEGDVSIHNSVRKRGTIAYPS